jgi:hypothetical protein
MFHFLSVQDSCYHSNTGGPIWVFFQQNGFFIVKYFTSVGSLSESNQKPEEEGKHSFAVSYLINSCGLSTKSAILPISD